MEEETTTVSRRRRPRREANPLLVKELRGRMRGARAFVVLTVYLLLLGCLTSMVYYTYNASVSGFGGALNTADLGRTVFATVVLIELFMVVFITPAFTAGAISGERERQTYELLRTTLLPARRLVLGKVVSALTYILLLVLAAVPLESLAFVLGGVVVEELLLALVILVVTALAFAVFGVFFSSLARTTLVSTVLTYTMALLTTIGLPLLLLIFALVLVEPFTSGPGSSATSWALDAALAYLMYIIAGLSPLTAAIFTEEALQQEGALLYFWHQVDATHRVPIPSAWIVYTVAYLVLAVVLLVVTVLRVRRQETQ